MQLAATFVTTMDNPYDYWTQFDEWYAFDTAKGYNTCSYLARVSYASTDMSDYEYERAVNDAVDEILRLNITGNYVKTIKVSSEDSNEENEIEESLEETEEEL